MLPTPATAKNIGEVVYTVRNQGQRIGQVTKAKFGQDQHNVKRCAHGKRRAKTMSAWLCPAWS